MEAFWRNILSFFFILLLVQEIISKDLHEEDLCQLNDNKTGVCLSIPKCWIEINAKLLKLFAKNNSLPICGFIDFKTLICCPTNFIPGMIAKSKCKEYAAVYHFCDNARKLVFDKLTNKTEKFPFTVSLGYGNQTNITWDCSGTLISEQWVLSAAHCTTLDSKGPIYARLGFIKYDSNEGEIVSIIERKNRPDYTDKLFYHDISLLKLEKPIKLSEKVHPACLPYTISSSNSYLSNSYGKSFLDYGDYYDYEEEKSQTLHKVTLNSINESICTRSFKSDSHLSEGFQHTTQLCLRVKEGSRDACRGDSGDGVYLPNKDNGCLFDIIGVSSAATSFCGTTNSFNIFTKINPYIGWIEKIVWPEYFP